VADELFGLERPVTVAPVLVEEVQVGAAELDRDEVGRTVVVRVDRDQRLPVRSRSEEPLWCPRRANREDLESVPAAEGEVVDAVTVEVPVTKRRPRSFVSELPMRSTSRGVVYAPPPVPNRSRYMSRFVPSG